MATPPSFTRAGVLVGLALLWHASPSLTSDEPFALVQVSSRERLTDAHLVAVPKTARVEQMGESHEWRDPRNGEAYTGVDAWVAALKDKLRQIEERSCAP